MNDIVLMIAVIGLLAIVGAFSALMWRIATALVQISGVATRKSDRERHDAMAIVSQFAEKTLCNPHWIAQIHANERGAQRMHDSNATEAEIKNEAPAAPDEEEESPEYAQTIDEAQL